jgi:hypothetical protein
VDPVGLGDVGGDVKYNLTPSLTLDGTYNTDFAQVEVDDQQVNLDRFNLFFPEKRPFFLENAGFFSVGNPGEVDLFFSRRIGIGNSGEAIPIIGGGRVSGKDGPVERRLLNMQTEEFGGITPSNNFGVVRLSRELPNRSAVGRALRQPSGVRRPRRERRLQPHLRRRWQVGHRAQRWSRDSWRGPIRRAWTGDDHAFNLRARVLYPRWDLDAGYQEVGDQFNPEVGFLTRGLSQARRPRDDALPPNGLPEAAGGAAARHVPRVLGLRRLPGDRLHAPRQPLAVQEQRTRSTPG